MTAREFCSRDKMVNLRASLSLFLVYVVACCRCESLTPLIAWSNSDVLSSVKQQQQQQVSSVAEVVEQLKLEGLVVVFRTDKLTFDDIAKYGGVYGDENNALGSLQGFMGGAESSLWSGIHGNSGSSLVDTLAWKMGVQPHYLKGLEDLSGFTSSPHLVVVDLPDASGKETFAQQDALMSEVMKVVRGLTTSFTAFYTGESNQRTGVPTASRKRRSLQPRQTAGENRDCAFSYARRLSLSPDSSCLLFCLFNDTFEYTIGTSRPCNLTLVNDNITTDVVNGSCEEMMCNEGPCDPPYIEAKFKKHCYDDPDIKNWILRFEFPVNFSNATNTSIPFGYWNMYILVREEGEDTYKNFTQKLLRRPFYPFAVPYGLSYSCSSPSYNNFTHGNESILLTGIQVQAYNVTYFHQGTPGYPVFSTYYDCEGFFTDASWMGVFTVIIFMVVYYIAIVFVFSINTVDRFDDPRGPTISVENLH